MKRTMVFFIALCCLFNQAVAADHIIKMLDYGESGSMVFEPDYLYAQPGDTVRFVPTSTGHNTRSYLMPKGAQLWVSKIDEVYQITLKNQGVYIYYCPPHLMMGMVGVIQVGKPLNHDVVEKQSSRLASKIVLNPQRLAKALKQVTTD